MFYARSGAGNIALNLDGGRLQFRRERKMSLPSMPSGGGSSDITVGDISVDMSVLGGNSEVVASPLPPDEEGSVGDLSGGGGMLQDDVRQEEEAEFGASLEMPVENPW